MDDFDEKLLQIIEERVSILFEIERAIFTKRYSLSAKHKDIFATQSISMIYSLWEGFVQKSFNLYIDELNKVKVSIDFYDFCDDIVIYHMENHFNQFKQYPTKDNKKVEFFASLKGFHSSSSYSIHRLVKTGSNVGFDVLNKLLKSFALEKFPEHWKDYTHPHLNLKESLEKLLNLRNTVAHGGELALGNKIKQEDYIRFKKLVTDLMYEMRLKMLDGLRHKTFLKSRQNTVKNDE